MTNKKENIRLLISLGLAGVMVAAILWLIGKFSSNLTPSSNSMPISSSEPSLSLPEWMSLGGKILVTADKTADKETGVRAFAANDFATAVTKFQSSLQTNRNDPETLIYLNNAKIGKSPALKVAVIAPIGRTLNEAKELLRGVAQAQDEVNNSGGINGMPLQLQIANVDNIEKLQELDNEFVKDSSLVAVVGFSRNEKIYNERGLVRISLTSPMTQLGENQTQPGQARYVFYASPNRNNFTQALAEYIIKKERRTNVAICQASTQQERSQEIKKQYADLITKAGGKITDIECNLSAPNFRASDFVTKAIADGAEALLLIPRPDKIDSALDVARESQGKLALFGSQLMYGEKVLKFGQGDVKGMVLPVSWHHDANSNARGGNSFANKAAKLWGGQVSPRTATAYDALQVIIAGLEEGSTRQSLQKVLSNPNFSATGATGKIQFSPSGDRLGGVFLVKVEPCESSKSCSSSTGYDFVLVQ
ncbi:ABC transporter substrate-binding protein [Komarekiella sp. 'clone 1']|uniref:ABC transporter substrate-binding protein n=1 Tax=Komarekiella delphini-convector SJRDD-AB1 TaxID=2593771 RepID=A0AA40T120_9NOST|nr:ABC transporter substrate-binding protein [Komarekiella delphini-convector]MBD6619024.1 ABC transporter substrate-binding protein [Komarekiella delphini-convector SJRDD-AB1]